MKTDNSPGCQKDSQDFDYPKQVVYYYAHGLPRPTLL
jgi:hypothetical protein